MDKIDSLCLCTWHTYTWYTFVMYQLTLQAHQYIHTYINPNPNQRYSCHLFRCVRLPAQPDATAPIIRKISRHLSAPQSPPSHAPRWKWSILFNDDDCNTFIHTYIHTYIHALLVKEDYNILYT